MISPCRQSYRGVAAFALACVIMTWACSHVLSGQPRALSARDSAAPTVAPTDLDKLLLSDEHISDIVGAGPLATFHTYSTITPADASETFSDPSCAEAVWNTMWTAYDGSGYTGALGHGLREPGDRHTHSVDQGVVAFPTADAATLFVARVTLAWQHCADAHFSDTGPTGPPPNTRTDWYTVGYPTISDISTLVIHPEGKGEQTNVRAITSRSNVVIDVAAQGPAMVTDKMVTIANAIAAKLPH
ncbi:sensor domain-containing protein [Mycobacterium sp. 050128]|uniref:sensor domain-containing protein n=1 Tax=unclassified Mycobacterium TaxID=2642494 RepID=UPI002ED7F0EB